jgi:hypothetical protein
VIPFEHVFWSNPQPELAVKTNPGAGWQFPQGAFSSPLLTLPDWMGPWPEINQALWRSECCHNPMAASVTSATVGLQLVAMTYDISKPVVLNECEFLCSSPQSAPFNHNVTDALKAAFAQAVPSRNNALQIGLRMRSDKPALVYSSRLMIVWKA